MAHAVLDRARGEFFGEPALDEHLHVLGLEPLRAKFANAHLVELVGAEIEDVLPVGLRCVTAVAVATAELLEVVIQVAHRRLLLRGGADNASGSASIAAICSSTAARRATDGSTAGVLPFPGLR